MKCFSWKVVAALAGAAAATYLIAPDSFAAAVPMLVVAACPLSLLVMMRALGSAGRRCDAAGDDEIAALRAEVAALHAGGRGASCVGPSGATAGER